MEVFFKRIVSALLAVLMAMGCGLAFGACAGGKDKPSPASHGSEEGTPCRIVTIGAGEWGSKHGLTYDHVQNLTQIPDESREGEKRTIEFAGREYELSFIRRVSFVVGDYTVDEYEIVSDDPALKDVRTLVRLLPDGSIGQIALLYGTLASINIKKNKSEKKMAAAVAEALKSEIDVSGFEHFKVSKPDKEKRIYDYSVRWYNETNGLEHGDSVTVSLDPEGNIFRVLMKCNAVRGLDKAPELKLEDYLPAIEAKLAEIYGEVKDYEFRSELLTIVEGSPCIFCKGDVEFESEGGTATDLFQFAVIPEN